MARAAGAGLPWPGHGDVALGLMVRSGVALLGCERLRRLAGSYGCRPRVVATRVGSRESESRFAALVDSPPSIDSGPFGLLRANPTLLSLSLLLRLNQSASAILSRCFPFAPSLSYLTLP